ncbi:MAG: hypothetical protein Q7T05_08650 [Dehalococcoidia bacterium]|nr:hypothetical protein [Dehalococcoidia bacterium]
MEAKTDQGLIAREQRLRATLLSALAAAFVMIAALLLFLLVPFFPVQVAVFLAVVLGVLAFKAPSPAVTAMVLLAIPGYIYQLGLPLLVVIGMAIVLFVPAASALQTGAVLGIATGAVAAMLMLTPLHFLALPIMIAIPLFRARGGKVGSTGAIIVFVALYLPLLVATQHVTQPDQVVPLLQSLHLDMKPGASVVDMGTVFSRLADGILMPGSGADTQFFKNLTMYLPVEFGGRVPPLGFVLAIAFAASIAGAFLALALFHWFERRETGNPRLYKFGPAASLFVADIVFLVPLALLSGPLAYTLEINPLGLLLSTAAIGAIGGLAESRLKGRDRMVRLREDLGKTMPGLRRRVDELKTRIVEAKLASPHIELAPEQGLVGKSEQELAFTVETVEEMTTDDMAARLSMFRDLDGKLTAALDESFRKLCLYYDDDRRKFNDIISSLAQFGVIAGNAAEGPALSHLEPLGYKAVLDLQHKLKNAYKEAVQPVASAVNQLEETVRSEVDPEFQPVGIQIARNYVTQEKHDEALETFLNELTAMERLVSAAMAGLEEVVADRASNLQAVIRSSLLKMANSAGELESARYYEGVHAKLQSIATIKRGGDGDGRETKRLPGLMETVSKVRALGEVTADVVARLLQNIARLETIIEAKVPASYNWGKNSLVSAHAESALAGLKPNGSSRDIHLRMARIAGGLKAIDEEATAVKQYSSVNEFLINYVNIEYLIDEGMATTGRMAYTDLPVKPSYAHQYLRLFLGTHYRRATLDEKSGTLKLTDAAGTV